MPIYEGLHHLRATRSAIQISCSARKERQSFLEWIVRRLANPISVYLHSYCRADWSLDSSVVSTDLIVANNTLKIATWPQWANFTSHGRLRLEGYAYAVPNCADPGSLASYVSLLTNDLTGDSAAATYDDLPGPVWAHYGDQLKHANYTLMPEDYLSYSVRGAQILLTSGSQQTLMNGTTNGYGHFEIVGDISLPKGGSVNLRLTGCNGYESHATDVDIRSINETGLTIVSDVDDVLRVAKIWDWNTMFQNIFLRGFTPWKSMEHVYTEWASAVTDMHFHYYSDVPEASHEFYMEGSKKLSVDVILLQHMIP